MSMTCDATLRVAEQYYRDGERTEAAFVAQQGVASCGATMSASRLALLHAMAALPVYREALSLYVLGRRKEMTQGLMRGWLPLHAQESIVAEAGGRSPHACAADTDDVAAVWRRAMALIGSTALHAVAMEIDKNDRQEFPLACRIFAAFIRLREKLHCVLSSTETQVDPGNGA